LIFDIVHGVPVHAGGASAPASVPPSVLGFEDELQATSARGKRARRGRRGMRAA
jgi:hypothetical protein